MARVIPMQELYQVSYEAIVTCLTEKSSLKPVEVINAKRWITEMNNVHVFITLNLVYLFPQECSSEIAESVPEIQEAFKYADKLIGDKNVDPSDKEAIQKDVKEIGEGFKNLKLELNDYEKE